MMDELVALCSQALRDRLMEGGSELAALRMEFALAQLHPVAELIMRWRYGLGCLPLSREHAAERLEVTYGQMTDLEQSALLDLGFAVLTLLDEEEGEIGSWLEAA